MIRKITEKNRIRNVIKSYFRVIVLVNVFLVEILFHHDQTHRRGKGFAIFGKVADSNKRRIYRTNRRTEDIYL